MAPPLRGISRWPSFGLDSVEVQYGVTLSAGLQTVFTAQAESSVQVTITLTRNHDKS